MGADLQEYSKVLSHSQLFRGVALADLLDLLLHGKIVETPGGENVIEEGSGVLGLYVILEGYVEIIKNGLAQVTQLGQGNFFGEISLFSLPMGATATVKCPEKNTCFLVSRSELGTWFKRHPSCELTFFRHLATELCNRLYSTTAKLTF